MSVLGGGLSEARHHEDALSVYEAELAMERRLGASEKTLFAVQTNLASTYMVLGRKKEAHKIFRDVYSRSFDLVGQDNERTLIAASNYADALVRLKRFENSQSVMEITIPVARRVLGESHEVVLRMRWVYAKSFYLDEGVTLGKSRCDLGYTPSSRRRPQTRSLVTRRSRIK